MRACARARARSVSTRPVQWHRTAQKPLRAGKGGPVRLPGRREERNRIGGKSIRDNPDIIRQGAEKLKVVWSLKQSKLPNPLKKETMGARQQLVERLVKSWNLKWSG